MPYISPEHRKLVDSPLEDLIEWVSWNVYLMGTRDDTLYHIIMKLTGAFYNEAAEETILPIDPDKRRLLDKKLNPLIDFIRAHGELMEKKNGTLNYTICRIINALYSKESSRYADYNNAIGVLENVLEDAKTLFSNRFDARGMIRCVMLEYYARRVRPYEQDAADLNGDLFE